MIVVKYELKSHHKDLLPNSSVDAMCSPIKNSDILVHATVVTPSSMLSSPKNGCTSNCDGHLLSSKVIQSISTAARSSSDTGISATDAHLSVNSGSGLQPQIIFHHLIITCFTAVLL